MTSKAGSSSRRVGSMADSERMAPGTPTFGGPTWLWASTRGTFYFVLTVTHVSSSQKNLAFSEDPSSDENPPRANESIVTMKSIGTNTPPLMYTYVTGTVPNSWDPAATRTQPRSQGTPVY